MAITITPKQSENVLGVIVADFTDSASRQRAVEKGAVEARFQIDRRLRDSLCLLLEGGLVYSQIQSCQIELTLPQKDLHRSITGIQVGSSADETLRGEGKAEGRNVDCHEVKKAKAVSVDVLGQIEGQRDGSGDGGGLG